MLFFFLCVCLNLVLAVSNFELDPLLECPQMMFAVFAISLIDSTLGGVTSQLKDSLESRILHGISPCNVFDDSTQTGFYRRIFVFFFTSFSFFIHMFNQFFPSSCCSVRKQTGRSKKRPLFGGCFVRKGMLLNCHLISPSSENFAENELKL